jgi:hypothetical protein
MLFNTRLSEPIRRFHRVLFGPRNAVVSYEAKQFLIRVARFSGDRNLQRWLEENRVFVYSGCSKGWTEKLPDGSIWLGINRSVLESPTPSSIFVAAHELKHVKQLWHNNEPSIFTIQSFRFEFEANEFGAHTVIKAGGFGLISLHRFRIYRWLISVECSFPGFYHVLAFLLFHWVFNRLHELTGLSRAVDKLFELPDSSTQGRGKAK